MAQDRDLEASDTDFEAHVVESEEEDDETGDESEKGQDLTSELTDTKERRRRSKYGDPVFKRVHVAPPAQPTEAYSTFSTHPQNGFENGYEPQSVAHHCVACGTMHAQGSCPLKLAGTEHCGLCGQAHYGAGSRKACTHLHSIEQCQLMLEALKSSPEPQELKGFVKKYLVGIIGNLRHDKKIAEEKKRESQQQQQQPPAPSGLNPHLYGYSPSYQANPTNAGYVRPYQVNGIEAGKGKEVWPVGHREP